MDKKKLNDFCKKSLKKITKNSGIKTSSDPKKIILLGDGSIIDSIGFVNFIVEVETLLTKELKKSTIIKIDKIHSINTGKKKLNLPDFINALHKLI
jgi:hypothetical protein